MLDDELLDEPPPEELLGSPEEELLSDEELLEIGEILDDEELGESLLELDRLPLLLELIDRYSRSVERIQIRPVLRHKGAMSNAKSAEWVSFSQNSVPHEP